MFRQQLRKDILLQTAKYNVKEDDLELVRPQYGQNGDFSTNLALKISSSFTKMASKDRRVGKLLDNTRGKPLDNTRGEQSPMAFAKLLTDSLQNLSYIKKLEVKEPGFINFFIKDEVWQNEVNNVLKAGDKFGSNNLGFGKKARVEFISANPTGPLHFGNARGGPIGDCLASVLAFSGYKVIREYLHNDIGGQVENLGQSIVNFQSGQKLEDQMYKGDYIKELSAKISGVKSPAEAGEKAVAILFSEIIKDAKAMGINFDNVYPESQFVKTGQTKKALELLEKKGALKKKEGAVWLATDRLLNDREAVVVKSDGSYTYFANDIAYHMLKFSEGADLVVDVLGANHHGHVPRMKSAISALRFDESKFRVILYQWVRFKRGKKQMGMSKRAGTYISVREVLEEVGCDALRFFVLMHDANSHMDFDLELARQRSAKNPVYYVQYANARIASILLKAKGLKTNAKEKSSTVNCELLTSPYELALIKQITRLEELVFDIAQNFAVHQLTSYAVDLADAFHKFYENCPVLTANDDVRSARLALCRATQIALVNTFALLGVSAPQKM